MDLISSFLNLKNWPIQTPDLSLKKNVISKPETAQDTFHRPSILAIYLGYHFPSAFVKPVSSSDPTDLESKKTRELKMTGPLCPNWPKNIGKQNLWNWMSSMIFRTCVVKHHFGWKPRLRCSENENKICARNENLLHLKILDALSRSAKDPMNI
jgi:hypothetical protein